MIHLHKGDCMGALPEVPTGSVRLVVTSPPYGIGKEYEGRFPTVDSYAAWIEPAVRECVRILCDGGSLCWQVGNWVSPDGGEITPLDAAMWPLLKSLGMRCRNRVVWSFPHGVHCRRRLSPRHESMLWMTKGDADWVFDLDPVRVPQKWPQKRHWKGPKKGELSGNPLGKNPGDVWEITNVKNDHPEKTDHPCQFPEELVRRCVLSLSRPGDVVVDPFAGSGTVGAVAEACGRSAILMERHPSYWAVIEARCPCVPFLPC